MCDKVRKIFAQYEDSDRLADLLEAEAPSCACEHCSVGTNSPGPVEPTEFLHRIISSPRDYDPVTGNILERPFHKVFGNGLSVWRALGDEDHIKTLLVEALTRRHADPPKSIQAVCEAVADEIRSVADEAGQQVFCVYDQTVTRLDPQLDPVPTHGAIFQRLPPPGTPGRKALQKDFAGKLREIFEKQVIQAAAYRNGLCIDLNTRAQAGDFIA